MYKNNHNQIFPQILTVYIDAIMKDFEVKFSKDNLQGMYSVKQWIFWVDLKFVVLHHLLSSLSHSDSSKDRIG